MKPLILMIAFICSYHLHAQKIAGDSFKRFGFQAGVNIANMDFNKGNPAPLVHDASAWKGGITLGFLVSIPLTKKLFLQPEYSFLQRNGADKTPGINYTLSYLSMPVLLNYQLSSLLDVFAGPQAELLIHAKSVGNAGSTDITHDTEERSIGATAGIGLKFKNNLFLSAKYMQGLNHVGIGQRSNVKEFVYEVVNITAGIRF